MIEAADRLIERGHGDALRGLDGALRDIATERDVDRGDVIVGASYRLEIDKPSTDAPNL